jgi:hypothetical protein
MRNEICSIASRNAKPGTSLLSHVQELLGALGDEVLKLRFLVVFEFSGELTSLGLQFHGFLLQCLQLGIITGFHRFVCRCVIIDKLGIRLYKCIYIRLGECRKVVSENLGRKSQR